MEVTLRDYLRDGEEVLWQGEPVDFPLLDDADRTAILVKWTASAVLAAALLAERTGGRRPESFDRHC